MATSAEIIIEFVNGRPDLLAEMRKRMSNVYTAPEAYAQIAGHIVLDAALVVSEREHALLNRVRNNGLVDWQAVADAFSPIKCTVCSQPRLTVDDTGRCRACRRIEENERA
jgi:hypothetical protein